MCRKVSYGFEKKEEKLRVKPDEAQKVRAFFEGYLAGASLKDAGAGIPLSVPALRDMMRNDLYAEVVGAETLALAQAEAERRTTRIKGWVGRKEQIVIPTRFTKAEEMFTKAEGMFTKTEGMFTKTEGETGTLAEMYRRAVPVW